MSQYSLISLEHTIFVIMLIPSYDILFSLCGILMSVYSIIIDKWIFIDDGKSMQTYASLKMNICTRLYTTGLVR